MSNFVQDFEEDEQFQSTIVSQSSYESPSHAENGGDHGSTTPTTASKKKRNLPGNPGKQAYFIHFVENIKLRIEK